MLHQNVYFVYLVKGKELRWLWHSLSLSQHLCYATNSTFTETQQIGGKKQLSRDTQLVNIVFFVQPWQLFLTPLNGW